METLQRLHNRGSISTGYNIDNSVKLEDTNTEYLQRPASGSDGSRTTMTLSMWIKRTQPGNDHIFYSQGSHVRFRWKSSDYFSLRLANGHEFEHQARLFRDTNAWYHMVVAIDTTQGTASNRVKIYWNGEQETNLPDENNPPDQNEQLTLGQFSSVTTQIGWFVEGGYGLDGYIAEVNYIDGIQQAVTEFGEVDDDSGIWKPKEYTGSYGNEGFYLNFDDSSSMGADSSGNSNNFNLNNVSAADQATDTPTNNFATLNVLNRNSASSGVTNNSIFTEGNTKITGNLSGYWQSGVSTIGITSGKWYFEAKAYDSNTHISTIGYGDEADIENWGKNNDFPGASGSKSYGYAGGTASGYGQIIPSTNQPSPAVTYNQTNIIGVAIDADNGYVYWSKDGTYINSGNPASGSSGTGGIAVPTGTGTNGTLFPAVGFYYHTTIPTMLVNFGGYTTISISSAASDADGYGTFEYAPPTGYYALCTKNLAEYG